MKKKFLLLLILLTALTASIMLSCKSSPSNPYYTDLPEYSLTAIAPLIIN